MYKIHGVSGIAGWVYGRRVFLFRASDIGRTRSQIERVLNRGTFWNKELQQAWNGSKSEDEDLRVWFRVFEAPVGSGVLLKDVEESVRLDLSEWGMYKPGQMFHDRVLAPVERRLEWKHWFGKVEGVVVVTGNGKCLSRGSAGGRARDTSKARAALAASREVLAASKSERQALQDPVVRAERASLSTSELISRLLQGLEEEVSESVGG